MLLECRFCSAIVDAKTVGLYDEPGPIRAAFEEVVSCFKAKANNASAIMCRKALEGLCAEHGIERKKKFKDTGVIEARLLEWAEALRNLGNEAAHGVSLSIS
ncbi:MAG TPA: DUF4145 domain-containing protein [Acidobacteriaceae bacterium]|nr:DUF4145 domain-containing protein [Acidobacteriaceae bacterium]